ncbi:cell division protein FtsQ/DivIB [Myceligenerans crystallogenes]|uniref:Cell division protein FtsQ n=1 Tax=Myceligenerans crystallogenes TaxID=316335 RepID=A0ABN2NLJ6_9MICO
MRPPSSPAGRKPTGPGRPGSKPAPARGSSAGTTARRSGRHGDSTASGPPAADDARTTGGPGDAPAAGTAQGRAVSGTASGTARRSPVRAPRPAGGPDARGTGTSGPVSVVGRIAERDAERRAEDRRRFWRRAAWAAGGAAVALGLVWGAFFSPLFALDPAEVTVTGTGTTIDAADVRAQIDPARGVPLPRVDTVTLRARLLTLNGVKDARVAHAWPHGLTIRLTSREPVVAVPAGGRYALLDDEGVRVGTTTAPGDVPVVDAPLSDDDTARAALFAALDVMAALPRGLAKQVTAVQARTQDDVRTRLPDGAEVIWGSSDRLELKIEVATTLRKAEPDASVYDVSSPDLPVTR